MKALAAVLGMLWASGAAAQANNCADRTKVVERLQSSYGEHISGGGLLDASQVIEIWFSSAKGNWTILLTHSNGVSCVMASGTNWRTFPNIEVSEGEDG